MFVAKNTSSLHATIYGKKIKYVRHVQNKTCDYVIDEEELDGVEIDNILNSENLPRTVCII